MERRRVQHYRHLPAFILLFLAQHDAYGAELLARLQDELPEARGDSAAVYRTLQGLEDQGDVESYWDTPRSGAPRKWYRITASGRESLRRLRDDVEASRRNLTYFLETYERTVRNADR